jgi:sugar lactone lactonase YvrE
VDGKEKSIARGLRTVAVAPHQSGGTYVLEEGSGRIWRIGPDGKRAVVDNGLPGARSLCLVPDQSLLLVAPDPATGKYGLSLRIRPDGTLGDRQHYHDIAAPYADPGTGASAMAVDQNGWLYVSSHLGIQMLDQAGRVNGIVLAPVAGTAGSLAFAGADRTTLFTTVGGKLYARRTKAVGAPTSLPPVKPPQPRL